MKQELAFRESNGVAVTVYWHSGTNRVSVTVFDACNDELFELDAHPAEALDCRVRAHLKRRRRRSAVVPADQLLGIDPDRLHGHRARRSPCAPPADPPDPRRRRRYFTSVSILNIGMYIEMMMMPTMMPTPIIMIGSTIDVSDDTAESTSSS
jgi:hypothetical protein